MKTRFKDMEDEEKKPQINDYFLFIPTFFTKLVMYSFFVIWFLIGLHRDIRLDDSEFRGAMTPLIIAIITMLFHLEYRNNLNTTNNSY